ncbi:hypothetical protein CFELI_14280 [Corynebacterium felinum]|nr:hypothetical protein CFELI_14280 [Corynebacterium felinum]
MDMLAQARMRSRVSASGGWMSGVDEEIVGAEAKWVVVFDAVIVRRLFTGASDVREAERIGNFVLWDQEGLLL